MPQSPQFGATCLYHYVGFMVSSELLGLAFLSLAVLMSIIARERTRASGLAIALWFFFVLVFELLLGGLVATGGSYGGEAFAYLLLLNPADVFRIPWPGQHRAVRPGQALADGLGHVGLDCGAACAGTLEI